MTMSSDDEDEIYNKECILVKKGKVLLITERLTNLCTTTCNTLPLSQYGKRYFSLRQSKKTLDSKDGKPGDDKAETETVKLDSIKAAKSVTL